MKYEEFENLLKETIISSYIKVMGIKKWDSLTDEQKNEVLHACLIGFAKGLGL